MSSTAGTRTLDNTAAISCTSSAASLTAGSFQPRPNVAQALLRFAVMEEHMLKLPGGGLLVPVRDGFREGDAPASVRFCTHSKDARSTGCLRERSTARTCATSPETAHCRAQALPAADALVRAPEWVTFPAFDTASSISLTHRIAAQRQTGGFSKATQIAQNSHIAQNWRKTREPRKGEAST